ncbi:MAG: DUF4233 domain-containing protein [Nocardioidaceae bacterium]
MRTLAATVLVSEALVIFFATLVAKDLSDVEGAAVWTVGIGAAVACLLLAGLLRWRWAYVAGSVLQVLVLASGFVVPLMFFMGAVFAGLWFLALYLPRRVERIQAEQAARRGPEPPS